MSLIHNEKPPFSKRANQKPGRSVYKNTVDAVLMGVFVAFGVAFAPSVLAQSTPLTLEQAQKQSTQAMTLDPSAAKDRDLRARAMQEAAQSYGARSGLLHRSHEIRTSVESTQGRLDAIWNFRPLMLTDAQPGERAGMLRQRLIVPPVIAQADQIFRQETPGLIRLVDKTYKLMSQPRFSSVTPSWRDYLFRDLGENNGVAPTHVSLLPRTEEERKNWNRWIADGWASGVSQADSYFEYDLNRLQRDFDGMILYHEMVAKKMISLPYVATANEPVSGDDTTLNINDSLLRITVLPSFQRDSKTWVPLQNGK